MANLNEKIAVKEQIEELLATLTRGEAFEVLDSILEDYPLEIMEHIMKNWGLRPSFSRRHMWKIKYWLTRSTIFAVQLLELMDLNNVVAVGLSS